jgi:hypothetical protein
MQSIDATTRFDHSIPWNEGKLVGPKPPLQTKRVWAIRSGLQLEGGRANSRCSILLSTAGCGDSTSSS